MSKAALRTAMTARLRLLTADGIAEQSASVTRQVLATPQWRAAQSVAVYLSAVTPGGRIVEVNTTALIQSALADGKTVCVPHIPAVAGAPMSMVPILSWADIEQCFAANRYGVRELTPADTRAPHGPVDVVIVPGVAFSTAGARIGRGRGYYDVYFATVPTAWLVGIAFGEQIVPDDTVPMEGHDVRLHAVVAASCPV